MKKIIYSTALIISLFLQACEPMATFDKPQPEDVNALPSIPKEVQGKFLSASKEATLTITDKLLFLQEEYNYKQHKDSLGTSFKIMGDTLINLTNGKKEKIIVDGDSIIQHGNFIDTIFNLSESNIIKKFKGFYFLNNKQSDNTWEVKKLSLRKNQLKLASINAKEDIQKLKEITETTDDTISTKFSLSKRQFKKFVRQEGFSENLIFNRIQ